MLTVIGWVVSAVFGGFIAVRYQRHHAIWLKRRDAAADAYEASVRLNAAITSSLSFARRVQRALVAAESYEFHELAQEADGALDTYLEAMRTAVTRLREAELRVRSVWGNDLADIFVRHLRIGSAWTNALADFSDVIVGNTNGGPAFPTDESGLDWEAIREERDPDTARLRDELELVTDWIRRFAKAAGVVAVDLVGLPWEVRDVLSDFSERRELEARAQKALMSGGDGSCGPTQ